MPAALDNGADDPRENPGPDKEDSEPGYGRLGKEEQDHAPTRRSVMSTSSYQLSSSS